MALFRSYLFAPGNNERLLDKVASAGADAVVLDLEDAVPPEEKDRARELVAKKLPTLSGVVYVRVNGVDTPWWRDDVAAVASAHIRGVRLPKAESKQEIETVATALDELEEASGLDAGSIELFATIETARGVWSVGEIAGVERVRNLTFGATDYFADVGGEHSEDESESLFARSRLVVASRACGIDPPVAPVYTDLDDVGGLRRSTEAARRLGFFGRSLIHPKQIDVVHDAFTPSETELERARGIVAAYETASSEGRGAARGPQGQFIDAAVARRARALVELADIVASNKE